MKGVRSTVSRPPVGLPSSPSADSSIALSKIPPQQCGGFFLYSCGPCTTERHLPSRPPCAISHNGKFRQEVLCRQRIYWIAVRTSCVRKRLEVQYEYYEQLADQQSLSPEEQAALRSDVTREVEMLEDASSCLRQAHQWASDKADELTTRLREGQESSQRKGLFRRAPANSVIDLEEEQADSFASGVNFYKVALICIAGSFAGVVVEILWCLFRNGYRKPLRPGLRSLQPCLRYRRGGDDLGPVPLSQPAAPPSPFSAEPWWAVSLSTCSPGGRRPSSAPLPGITVGCPSISTAGSACSTLCSGAFWASCGSKSLYPRVAQVILKIPQPVRQGPHLGPHHFHGLRLRHEPAGSGPLVRAGPWETPSPRGCVFDEHFPDSRMERIYANMEFGTNPA